MIIEKKVKETNMFVKLDRLLTVDDVGKKIVLRNGDEETILEIYPDGIGGNGPWFVNTSADYHRLDGGSGTGITGHHYHDIVKIETFQVLENITQEVPETGGLKCTFTIPIGTVSLELEHEGYNIFVGKKD
jgi:hypothetical protein